MEIIFATNNRHKLQEVKALTGETILLKSLSDINCFDEIPETGITFNENASQKSRYIFDRYKMNCIGDDSGLEVESLNYEPGVFSARYSGTRDMEANVRLILDKLKNHTNRKARFRTVISLIWKEREYFFEGTIDGHITEQSSGLKGFGYDPIFIPAGYNQTFAEMTFKQKNMISHRAIALKKMLRFLKQIT